MNGWGASAHENNIDSNFRTTPGTCTAIAGNLNVTSYGENSLNILYRSICADAVHNSAARPPNPSRHPGTRNQILEKLDNWLGDQRQEGTLLWLHGTAGAGKSAIAQTFSWSCQDQGLLGGSFFFLRRDPDRGNWRKLFPTLAYQLAAAFPEISPLIQPAVETDKLVVSQTMLQQFQKLITAPLEQSPTLAFAPILIIDGLDECENHGVQITLLQFIIEALRTRRISLRVLTSSRSEHHIRAVLQAAENFDICRHVKLRADDSAYAAISRYLRDEFARIRQVHGTPIDNGWPDEDHINHLVKKSSGTFIYATTVIRYIDDEYSHPQERLESVLSLDPESTTPLDDLYTQILSEVPNSARLRRILHALVATDCKLNPEEIDIALQLRSGTSRLALRGLHSVVSVSPVRFIGLTKLVNWLHASLQDFLIDATRSPAFCVANAELECDLVRSMIVHLQRVP
ncbi:hypothetical protein B0H11DRAFT_2295204 [Mycena galericulata]|nr:hypothetical protein B0H11DRAFT_2295204 [Mycena galericulata]